MNFAPAARILLRYSASALVTLGLAAPGLVDSWVGSADAVAVTGALIGFGVEIAYGYAKKKGWAT